MFSLLGLTRMTTALLKDTARLFTCAAADIEFLRCMIFSNFQIFKFSNLHVFSEFRNFTWISWIDFPSCIARASEAYSRITFVWRIVWRPRMACVCQGAPRSSVEHCPRRKVRLIEDVHAVHLHPRPVCLEKIRLCRSGADRDHLLFWRIWC